MTHLPYVVASYTLFALLALGLVASTSLRLRQAARRLRAIDPRAQQDAP
jgi:Heme exporter protein D (CcmD)